MMVAGTHGVIARLLPFVRDGQNRRDRSSPRPWRLRQHRVRGDFGVSRFEQGHALDAVADIRPAAEAELEKAGLLFPIALLDDDDRLSRERQIAARPPIQIQAGQSREYADDRPDFLPRHGLFSPWDQTTLDGCGEGSKRRRTTDDRRAA